MTAPRLSSRIGNWSLTLLTIFAALFTLFPIYWMAKGSVETSSDLLDPHLLPRGFSIDNFSNLLQNTQFSTYFTNSMSAAVLSTLLSVSAGSIAGYGLARFEFRGRKAIARSVLFVYMFPALALAIPLYAVFFDFGLTNGVFGIALAHTSLSLPFGVWLMWQFFQTVPRAYQESAYVLGAGRIRTFWQVELPQVRSGLIALAIFAFALSWEDYTFSFILSTQESSKTLPVGITNFVETDVVNWGLIQSAGVFMAIPTLLIVLFLQRYLIKGLGAGGLKG